VGDPILVDVGSGYLHVVVGVVGCGERLSYTRRRAMSETKFTRGPCTVGANEMTVSEMKERLAETFDASVENGDATDKLWSVFVGSEDSPLMCCYTGNGPTSEANAYLFAAASDLYASLEAMAGKMGKQDIYPELVAEAYVVLDKARCGE